MSFSSNKLKGKKNTDFIIGIIILLVGAVFFATDWINYASHKMNYYDEAYNASVAANVVRYGEYRVSYPEDITFYHKISTGETVILPAALVYKLCGINELSTSIVAIIYAVLAMFSVWLLLLLCIGGERKHYILTSLLTVALILSDSFYHYISTNLIGEGASIFFLALSFIMLYKFEVDRKTSYIMLAGAMSACAFLTKTTMIFFVVSFFGMLLIEALITKLINIKNALCYYLGFVIGFVILDLYKLIQLGGFARYIDWWKGEWEDMMDQSSGMDFSLSIHEKFDYLESIFIGADKYFCLWMLAMPVVFYALYVLRKIAKKEDIYGAGTHVMSMAGVGGASLIIYFILLGGKGLRMARRHEVNQLFVRLFMLYIIAILIIWIVKVVKERLAKSCEKDMQFISEIVLLVILLLVINVCPLSTMKSNLKDYITKEHEIEYKAQLMHEFLDEVSGLPEDAVIYCAEWWHEPDVTLYLDRDMRDIYNVLDGKEELTDNSYFIVGLFLLNASKAEFEAELNADFIKVDTSDVDYNRCIIEFDRQDFDNFAIYKIENRQ